MLVAAVIRVGPFAFRTSKALGLQNLLPMSGEAARPSQTDDERPERPERPAAARAISVPLRAIGASLALGLVLGVAATLAWRSPGMSGVDGSASSLEFVGLADDSFEIPHLTLPAEPCG